MNKKAVRKLALYFRTGGKLGECPSDLDVDFYLVCIELSISPDELRDWSVKDYNSVRMILEARALASRDAEKQSNK